MSHFRNWVIRRSHESIALLLVWTRGAVCPPPLKWGLPSREAKKLRGQHDLDFAEEATEQADFKWTKIEKKLFFPDPSARSFSGLTSKRRIRFWRARDNCLTLCNEAGAILPHSVISPKIRTEQTNKIKLFRICGSRLGSPPSRGGKKHAGTAAVFSVELGTPRSLCFRKASLWYQGSGADSAPLLGYWETLQ